MRTWIFLVKDPVNWCFSEQTWTIWNESQRCTEFKYPNIEDYKLPENYSGCTFQLFYFKTMAKAKSEPQVWKMGFWHFFRHQYWQNWLMTYVICWCHMRHLMSYVSFDVKWLILLSKEALGPQLYNLWVQFDIRNCFKIK